MVRHFIAVLLVLGVFVSPVSADLTLKPGTKIVFGDGTTLNSALSSGLELPAGHGGTENLVLGTDAYIGGGYQNVTTNDFGAIGGGWRNAVFGNYAAVSGGRLNTASGLSSAVGGGVGNAASGIGAAVPGGASNNAAGDYSFAMGYRAQVHADHDGAILFADTRDYNFHSAAANEFAVRCTGGARIVTAVAANVFPGFPTAGVYIGPGGTDWEMISARSAKENFGFVDGEEILGQVVNLPVHSYNYRHQDASVRHLGPMAEDFHAAFGLNGAYRGTVTSQDLSGVALAAIQGLNARLLRAQDELADKQAQIDGLESRLAVLEAMLAQNSR